MMRTLKFLTWLDIRRLVRKKTMYGSQMPEGIVGIDCFSDALEINLKSLDDKPKAESILQNWFGEWYIKEQQQIQLDLDNSSISVDFLIDELDSDSPVSIRPFWEEVAYIKSVDQDNTILAKNVQLPQHFTAPPSLTAFYSFKGGVGRTLHLAAHLFALLECAKELKKSITVLVIDADLEAPGLTYWNRSEKQQPAISFIDFLESYHYSSLPVDQTLDKIAEEVKKSPKHEGQSVFYFLPACLDDEQLLDIPVLPEHLTRSPEGGWTCGNAIHQLGKALNADYVLVDLRAGLSEISSPLIFDPRVQRFFITTASEQSVSGLSLVLEQISRVVPSENDLDNNSYFDPSIIVSFLTPELKSLSSFDDALTRFRTSYVQPTTTEEDDVYSKRLDIKETDFSQGLLHVNTWEEAQSKLHPTSIMIVAREWAESQLKDPINQTNTDTSTDLLEEVRKFRAVCQKYEFAESGAGEGLLITEPLKNLATNFRTNLPRVVSLGAKGSGKTFIYVQLSRLKYWDHFLQMTLKENSEPTAYIFPFLQSRSLQDNAKSIIESARDKVRIILGDDTPEFSHSYCEERIQESLDNKLTELEWTKFWIHEIACSIGMISSQESSISLQDINNFLKNKNIRLIFLFDGLEDIFERAADDDQQKCALKALITLPDKLSEIREAHFGLIILLRRDFLRYAITQNSAQFEKLYSSYDLSWDVDSFLKLVYWVCSQAKVIGASEEKIDTLGREELVSNLERLWGNKLGGVREARTASWVFAALTDFTGKLQARDIVRLLFHAADITIAKTKEIQFEKWSTSRLLPPQAIRRALDPCSEKKVSEAKEEYPAFRDWVDKVENEYTQEQKRIPFTDEDLGLNQSTVRMLKEMGVIYEDRAKDDIPRYYMPEIFRAGLKFTLETGKRPRVLVLKRKALGIGVL